jgi:hypothetical protein
MWFKPALNIARSVLPLKKHWHTFLLCLKCWEVVHCF